MLVDVQGDERGRVPDREGVLGVADVVEEAGLVPVVRGPRPAAPRHPARLQVAGPIFDGTEVALDQPDDRSARGTPVPAQVVEVDLVVLDPADRERELEPHIDEQTMRLHHDKHHQAYVDKANAALEGTQEHDASVEHVLTILDELPEDKRTVVRNNAGGHANHSLFWEIMSPDGGGEPEGPLAEAIDDTFGSLDELKKAVNDGGVNRFGSGWTWLVHDGTGLSVYSLPNQDSPIMQSDEPLLGIDVWEHAYYLKYQNRRPDYLEAWWNVVNWQAVAERYARATGKVGATTG